MDAYAVVKGTDAQLVGKPTSNLLTTPVGTATITTRAQAAMNGFSFAKSSIVTCSHRK